MNKLVHLILLSAVLVWVDCTREHKIIIVGAGPSGIATASKLLENGIDDLLILEAEPRVGGRIKTVNFEKTTIDLGAEWVHGEKNSVVFETLQQLNLTDLLNRDQYPHKIFTSGRQNISDEFSEELLNTIFDLYFDENIPQPRESVGSYIQRRFNPVISAKFGGDVEKLEIAKCSLDFLRHAILCLEGSFSWYDTAFTSDYEDCEGFHNWGWKQYGYHKFLDVLTKKFPNPSEQLLIDNKIRLSKEVTKININDDNVKVTCFDNSVYLAKHVVFTPSLGVLKAKANTLFVPELPRHKLQAIERIGFGAIMKVFLKYDKKWWKNEPGFNLIWNKADRLSSKEKFPEGPTNSNGESWIVEIYNIFVIPDTNVVMVFFTGEFVPIIEKLDAAILTRGIEHTFDLFLGHLYDIPRSISMIRSNWFSNPNFRGTYSFASVNSSGEDVKNLLAPITRSNGDPILQFAGEATSPKHHSTVHGAVETGFREAIRLIEFYKKKRESKQSF